MTALDADAAALRDAVVRHLDAEPAGIQLTPRADGSIRIDSRLMGWTADPQPRVDLDPYRLYELTSDVTPFHTTEPRPVIAILHDGRSFFLNRVAELASFLVETIGAAEPLPLARVVTHLHGQGMERVVSGPSTLSDEAVASLRESGIEPDPPVVAAAEDGIQELRYLSEVLRPAADGDEFVADLRAWTVRRLPDGTVDWQSRPVAQGLPITSGA